MGRLTISSDKKHFLKNGKPFFYLADTVWSTSTNTTLEEFEEYLQYRCFQGYNALQINILPQWDRSMPDLDIHPFERTGGKRLYDFSRFQPIYMISGDTDFKTDKAVAHYLTALQTVKETDPDALTTFHLNPFTMLPETIVQSEYLDYYMYQSSHMQDQTRNYKLAEAFASLPVKRAIINGEPCYEGIGEVTRPHRFAPYELRRAAWQSLLSGATLGITYGAHGIWSFHKRGGDYEWKELFSKPFDWRTALRFPGAWDFSLVKSLFEQYDLFGIEPVDCIEGGTEEIRMAMTPDKGRFAIYLPYSLDVTVKMDLSRYDVRLINLKTRYTAGPKIISEGPSGARRDGGTKAPSGILGDGGTSTASRFVIAIDDFSNDVEDALIVGTAS